MNLFHEAACPNCPNHKIAYFPDLIAVVAHPDQHPAAVAELARLVSERREWLENGRLPLTPYCSGCICSSIASADEILSLLSDPANRVTERAWLISLIRSFYKMAEDHEKYGRAQANIYPEAKNGGR